MTDDLTKRGSPDSKQINVNEEWEVRYWTDRLGISEEQLRKAVGEVGPSVKAVEDLLDRIERPEPD